MKRILSFLLALMLVVTLVPIQPMKAEAAKGGKLIAMTLDDGPHNKYTKQLLDGLAERGVKVTFFMLGQSASYYPSLVKRAYEEGHEIACHTWSHPDLTGCSDSKIKTEISDTLKLLDKACGAGADYLVRPPYGSTNERVRKAIDYPLIYWSIDSEDWSLLNTEKVRKKIVADAYDGAIILCHDIHKTTIPAVLGAIDDLMDKGYEFVTVSELFRRRGRTLQDHKLHYNSKRNGTDYGPIPAPTVSVVGDARGSNTVTITCSDKNAPLYYTLDGSYPNQTATKYTGPFTVPYGTKVTAVAAYKLNGSRSELTVKIADSIHIQAPVITLDSSGKVVMKTETVNSQIRYTVDGSKPGSASLRYSGPEWIDGPCMIRAVTIHDKGVSTVSEAFLSENGELYYDMHDGNWFYDAMNWAHEEGILNGVAPYIMDPAGKVTRGMLVTLLYRFSGEPMESDWQRTNTFADVNQSYYYAEPIEWAYRNHIVDGYSDAAFGPDDIVTRQQMCKIVHAFLGWMETPLVPGESCEDLFADYDEVAYWAIESVDAMVAAGLIQGDGINLNPNDGANRAQFCVLLQRLAAYIANYEPPVEEPTEPEEPSEPSEPEEPSDPTEPEDPTDPTEPEDPTDPTEPENPTDPTEPEEPTDPTEPEEPTDPTEPEDPTDPTEPEDPTDPTEPEDPTDPTEPEEPTEPSEPEHVHEWKLNKAGSDNDTVGDVSIAVGESFNLRIICKGKECMERPETAWTADREGVVSIDGTKITGLTAGKNTWVSMVFEGVTYKCIIRVRNQSNELPAEPIPMMQ